MKKYITEICVTSVDGCIAAQEAGAQRVELCTNLEIGGTTPSLDVIKRAREALHIDLFVLIRTRGGDFCYNKKEMDAMVSEILDCKKHGVDGVVFGCLDASGAMDLGQTRRLVEDARPMQVTFHRAIDECSDPLQAIDRIASLGIERVLTSGTKQSAVQGIPIIKQMIERSAGRIKIMPGAGINSLNIKHIAEETGVSELHFSGLSEPTRTESQTYKDTIANIRAALHKSV